MSGVLSIGNRITLKSADANRLYDTIAHWDENSLGYEHFWEPFDLNGFAGMTDANFITVGMPYWREFLSKTGLSDTFARISSGGMMHLSQDDLDDIITMKESWKLNQSSNITVPTKEDIQKQRLELKSQNPEMCQASIDYIIKKSYDMTYLLLIWLMSWVEWALQACAIPVIRLS